MSQTTYDSFRLVKFIDFFLLYEKELFLFLRLCSTVAYMQPPPESGGKRNVHSKINLSQCSQLQLLYHIMQRSSSCKEPRHPLVRVLIFYFIFFILKCFCIWFNLKFNKKKEVGIKFF